jgi:GNAT superfamily N-acetyltransferase
LSQPRPTVLIRDARLTDAPMIVEFSRLLALETEGKVLDPAKLEAGVTQALADPDRLRFWIAEISSPPRTVGQVAITREWSDWRNGWVWWLQSVYVVQAERGRGVFRALFEHIHQQALANPDVIGLRLYVENANQAAMQTYQSMGMKPGGYSVYELLWLESTLKHPLSTEEN